MVEPGQPNPSMRADISALAISIYNKAEKLPDVDGHLVAMNTAGLVKALKDHDISCEVIEMSKDSIDAALDAGCPVIIHGEEATFVHVNGDSPYHGFDPTKFRHCIILSGIEGNNGYMVRDCANPGRTPDVYDKRKMDITVDDPVKIIPNWSTTMQHYKPGKGDFDQFFTKIDDEHWRCKQTGAILQFGNLAFYQTLSIDGLTLPIIGLPLESEQFHKDPDGYEFSLQRCERATIVFDPQHKKDNPPGSGASYLAHVGAPFLSPSH
jgi:hypothetical protein